MHAKQPHPHFDDRGTLSWHTRWSAARAAAANEGKLIFIEFGRELCGQCRTLVQSVLPRPDVAPLLQQHFVALAADADDSEDEVLELAAKLEDAYILPFVLFADAQGRFLGGMAGEVQPAQLVAKLHELTRAG